MNCNGERPRLRFPRVLRADNASALLQKLRYDHARLTRNPIDSYAAFDFFVTANHLVDWCWPSASRKQLRDNRRADVLRRLCEHLGDGAKHFLLSSEHQGVEATTKRDGLFQADFVQADAFDIGELMITLEPNEAGELGRSSISAIDLATLVLAYWEKRIGSC